MKFALIFEVYFMCSSIDLAVGFIGNVKLLQNREENIEKLLGNQTKNQLSALTPSSRIVCNPFEDLEQCDLPTLISITETNEELAPQVREILRRKFSEKDVYFIDPYHTGEIENHISELDKSVSITYFETASKLLKNYGSLLQSVTIWHTLPLSEMSYSIYKSVNLYCSDSLKSFLIRSYHQAHSLAEYTKPFKNAEHVSLFGLFSDFGSSALRFGELFPAMHSLNLEYIHCKDMSWMNQTYSHLKSLHLRIEESNTQGRITTEVAEQLMTKNPQINFLTLLTPPWHFLTVVCETYSDLEMLEIQFLNELGNSIGAHFKNVNTFKFMHSSHILPANITFDKLNKFITDAEPYKWVKLIERTKTLKELVVERKLSNFEFGYISEAKSELRYADLWFQEDIKGETIVDFLQNNEKLVEVVLGLEMHLMTPIQKYLEEHVGEEWIIAIGVYPLRLYREQN